MSSRSLKTAACKAQEWSHVEYCNTVWDPPTAHLTHKVEMVQRRLAKWVYNKYRTGMNTTSPTEMIKILAITKIPSQSFPPLPTL